MEKGFFESFVNKKLPREDDRQLFNELFEIYQKQGKDALAKHLKELIAELEG